MVPFCVWDCGVIILFRPQLSPQFIGDNSILVGVSPGQDDLEVKFTVHVMFHHDNRFPVNFTLLGPLTQKPSDTWCYNAEITPKGKFGSFALCTSMYEYL